MGKTTLTARDRGRGFDLGGKVFRSQLALLVPTNWLAFVIQNEYSVFVQADRPSKTAEYMAIFRAVESAGRSHRRLFEDVYAVPLLSGALKSLAKIAHFPLVGRFVPLFLDLGWPYTRSSGVVRTRLIDDLVRDAIEGGVRQLILLGAGFDSRAYRLEEAKKVVVFEVDHPATQRAKRERLSCMLGHLPDRVRFVEVNFEKDDLRKKLRAAGFHEQTPAVVVWEGVISYLTEPAVSGNLSLLGALLAENSRLIFTYVHKGALDGSVRFGGSRRWKSWVSRSGEPFIFGFDPATLPATLRTYGFLLEGDSSTAEAARQYCRGLGRKETGSALYRVASARRLRD